MSIKARLLISIGVAIAIAFVVIGVATVTVTRNRMVDRLDADLMASPNGPPRSSGRNEPSQGSGYYELATASIILDRDGNTTFSEPSGWSNNPDPLPDIQPDDVVSHLGEIYTVDAVGATDERYRVLIRSMDEDRYLATAVPMSGVDKTIENLIAVIGGTGMLVLAVATLFVWLTIRRGLRPIDSMISTAGLIANGDLSQRVENDDATTEVGHLAKALNVMLGQIEVSFAAKEESERRLRQFVADASHELRTPLTSIRGYTELYRGGAASSPEGIERVMVRIESEGKRMGDLVDDLLLLARLDQGRPLQCEPLDLVQVVGDAVMDAQVTEPERRITFEHPAVAVVLGDANRLRQVVDNLLTNARVHTDRSTPIKVVVAVNAPDARIRIIDEGPGIASEDAAHVFDRFYRVDTSRARGRGGTGLGLSIVRSIINAHGGTVGLDTEPGRGTTATVTLALSEVQEPELVEGIVSVMGNT